MDESITETFENVMGNDSTEVIRADTKQVTTRHEFYVIGNDRTTVIASYYDQPYRGACDVREHSYRGDQRSPLYARSLPSHLLCMVVP